MSKNSRRTILKRSIAFGSSAALGLNILFPTKRSHAGLTRKRTPAQIEGPFYPLKQRDDNDNNLVSIRGKNKFAEGNHLKLWGRVFNMTGHPLIGARVDIWQCDHRGIYHHVNAPSTNIRDTLFQGYGKCHTGTNGEYSFTTLIPASYEFRAPHIHVKIFDRGIEKLTTQLYLKDHPRNAKDFILLELLPDQRKRLMIKPLLINSRAEAPIYNAVFNFIL